MSRGRLLRRFPVLRFRNFRLLLADRLIAPASVGFSIVGVVASALALIPRDIRTIRSNDALVSPVFDDPAAKLEAVPR